MRVLFNGQGKGTFNLPATQMTKGRIGLCAGYPAARAVWDDVTVRRFVQPEPSVAIDPEVVRCP